MAAPPGEDLTRALEVNEEEERGKGDTQGARCCVLALLTVAIMAIIVMAVAFWRLRTPPIADHITLVFFNDVYELRPVQVSDGTQGGVARAATVINEARARNPGRTFTLFAGDLLSPSAWSSLFFGRQMVALMNAMKLDVACLGNHEFDFGLDVFDQRVAESKFSWVNVNFMDKTTGKITNGTIETHAVEIPFPNGEGGVDSTKMCVFGTGYDFRESLSRDTHLMDFKDTVNASKETVAKLKSEGCKIIVALTHQFNAEDCTLSGALGGDVDLILGGHDHTGRLEKGCGGSTFIKADSDLKTMWVVDLHLASDGTVSHQDLKYMTIDDSIAEDPEIKAAVDVWARAADEEFKKPAGCSLVDLDAGISIRRQEMPLGNFFADSMRKEVGIDPEKELDVALIGGGDIRGGAVYPKGQFTLGDVNAMHPFGNLVIKLHATGAAIRQMLELGLACFENTCGEFNQASGIRMVADVSRPEMSRITSLTLEDGTTIQDDQRYKLGVTDYAYDTVPLLAEQPFFDMKQRNDGRFLIDYVMEAFAQKGDACINPSAGTENPRITVVGVSARMEERFLEEEGEDY